MMLTAFHIQLLKLKSFRQHCTGNKVYKSFNNNLYSLVLDYRLQIKVECSEYISIVMPDIEQKDKKP